MAKNLIGQKCNKGFLAVFVFVLQEGAEKLTSSFRIKDAVKWCQDIWRASGDTTGRSGHAQEHPQSILEHWEAAATVPEEPAGKLPLSIRHGQSEGRGNRSWLKGGQRINANQYGFMESRSCQPSFHSQRRLHVWLIKVTE